MHNTTKILYFCPIFNLNGINSTEEKILSVKGSGCSIVLFAGLGKNDPILLRYQLEGIVKLYGAEVIDVTEEAEQLADEYVKAEAFTENNYVDALHVSIATYGKCDVVVSWNFRHIARAWTIKKVTEVNRRLGLPDIVICTPEEVVGDA